MEVHTSSAAFLVHWLNFCDSLLSYLYYVHVDSVSYLKKKNPLLKKKQKKKQQHLMLCNNL